MHPRTLDHVALWVSDRDRLARACEEQFGMHVIDRSDRFTLVGSDARRGKLTFFAAEGPRDRGALKHVALRVSRLEGRPRQHVLDDGLQIHLVEAPTEVEFDLDHVALFSRDPEAAAADYVRLGLHPAGTARVEVGGAFVELHPGDPGESERPLLNHLGLLVDSAEEHRAAAEERGFEVTEWVDAPNTLAVFVLGPDGVRVEYVEHKPTFSLV